MLTNLLCVAVLVAADRIFKAAAVAYLPGRSIVLIPGILGLNLLEGGNTGAAFGMFSDSTKLLAALSAVCSAVLIVLLIINKFGSQAERWGMVMICAGAIGNLYDRVFIGSVTDYLEFLFMDFPIFNFADALVNVGCFLVGICVLFLPEKKREFRVSEEAEREDEED